LIILYIGNADLISISVKYRAFEKNYEKKKRNFQKALAF